MGNRGAPRIEYRCSFCGKKQDQVHRLIAGPGGVYICDECVDLCREIIEEQQQDRSAQAPGSAEAVRATARARATSIRGASRIAHALGDEAESLLGHVCHVVDKSSLHLPGPDFVDRVLLRSDRSNVTLRSLQQAFRHGRLAGTGYLSVLSVDEGAGAALVANPLYADPANAVRLAVEGGCSAIAAPLGLLGAVSRGHAHDIPFIVRLNHAGSLPYPHGDDGLMFARAKQAWNMGALGVGATIGVGSVEEARRIAEVSEAFQSAHDLGLFTVLWDDPRGASSRRDGDRTAADPTGQVTYLSVALEADLVVQRLPTASYGSGVPGSDGEPDSVTRPEAYHDPMAGHPIDLCRYQVVSCYRGRSGLLSSGDNQGAGTDADPDDGAQTVRRAVVNKRAGGMGHVAADEVLRLPIADGIALLNRIQDVYLSPDVTVA